MNGEISKGRRILIVEDHADSAVMLSRFLVRSGYEVASAATVSTALELVSNRTSETIHLVVSDLGLPDGNGLELMQRLRDDFRLPGIAVSGYGQAKDVARALASGFSYHLTKPVDFEKLQNAIDDLLATQSP